MTLILSGTNGLSDVDGSAATPAIRGTDANTGIFFPAADTIAFSEGGTEAMRIDSSGNVGIGVTPSAWGGGYKALQIGQSAFMSRTAGSDSYIFSNSFFTGSVFRYINTAAAAYYGQDAGTHKWYNAASGTAGDTISFTQAMTLDASGNLLVGTTSQYGSTGHIVTNTATATWGIVIRDTAVTTGLIKFEATGGATVGSITVSGGTSTVYATSSDYRLKENIEPMTGALSVVSALKPCTYTWKENGEASQGFIAHELQAVVPDAVVGEKDAVNEDGSIKAQGIDTSFLVATLTAAIQEQQAIITQLQADVAALKAQP